MDDIFATKLGGRDDAENLVYACRICNSSKGKKDLIEWMEDRRRVLPLMVIRRYLKLAFTTAWKTLSLLNEWTASANRRYRSG